MLKRRFFNQAMVIGLALCFGADAARAVHIQTKHYIIAADSEAVVKQRARQLEWSAWVFEDLFGVAPPTGEVTLTNTPEQTGVIEAGHGVGGAVVQATVGDLKENWSLQWFIEPPGQKSGRPSGHDALTHEAAHLQLIYLVNDQATDQMKLRYNGYGAYLPDWIDEAVAVYHESQEVKRNRRTQLSSKLIPLRDLFEMSHPMFADKKRSAKSHGSDGVDAKAHDHRHAGLGDILEDGKVSAGELIEDGDRLETLKAVNQFYVQSFAVLEYMIDEGGKPFVRYMIDQHARGRTMDGVLRGWQKKQRELSILQRAMERTVRAQPAGNARGGKMKQAHVPARQLAGIPVRPGDRIGRMPGSVRALDKAFDKWVRRHYPRHEPELPKYPE